MYETTPTQGARKVEVPLFKADIVLSIPNIIMIPGLDDVQQSLNNAIRMVLSVSKNIYQWGQKTEDRDVVPIQPTEVRSAPRLTVVGPPPVIHKEQSSLKTYFKSISENKDISKMASLLSTAINATKLEINKALEQFKVSCNNFIIEYDLINYLYNLLSITMLFSGDVMNCSCMLVISFSVIKFL